MRFEEEQKISKLLAPITTVNNAEPVQVSLIYVAQYLSQIFHEGLHNPYTLSPQTLKYS